jgi:hypothetical protein
MSPSEITVATQQLSAMLESPGWREVFAPALRSRIAGLERSLVSHEKPLSPEDTVSARLERHLLKSVLEKPDELIRSYHQNLAKSERGTIALRF